MICKTPFTAFHQYGTRACMTSGLALGMAALPGAGLTQSAESHDLGTLVLTAAGFEQQLTDAPASITVIDQSDIEGRSVETVTDLLRTTAGVSVEQGGKLGGQDINIRGLGEDYVLMLVDGKPIGASQDAFYNGWGTGQRTGFLPPVSAIERIEVIRGPMSSLYGSAASAGVINVITKKVPDEWGGSITLGYTAQERGESGDEAQGRYYLSGPISENGLGLTFYGQTFKRHGDTFEGGFPGGTRDTHGVRLDWVLSDRQDLSLDYNYSWQDFENTEFNNPGSTGTVQNERHYGAITHSLRWGDGHETTSFLTRETVDIYNGDLNSRYEQTNLNTRTVMSLDNHMLSFGGDYKLERTRHDAARFAGSINSDLERWHYALFAEDEWRLTPDFTMTLGLRYDYNEHYDDALTPRIYGVYRLTPSLTLKGGISGGYLVPDLKQADDNIVEPAGRGAGWDKGNTNLEPEESLNYELGFVYDAPSGLQASLVAYHTDFKNKIDRERICDSPAGAPACSYNGQTRQWIQQYVNRDKARLQGIEATLDIPLGDFDIGMNYTYSDSEITSGSAKGERFSGVPEHLFNVRVDWQTTPKLNLWTEASHRGEAYTSGYARNSGTRTPPYTLVNMGLNYDFNDRVQGHATIYNLFDKRIDQDTYNKTLDGRRLYVGVTTSF
ncbi:outer membrane receptor for ferrienterochelin and colicins [Roseovarius pacificus]|uniref:Outer membrane receptor for ferrienterochelin and colicins n=2 Tax=Roseovarius pacificus TaxID=337701 RepID=A0A1M7A688_9RHOB|nr:ligand-gated channel protein [Roseovarius pacificus]SHL38240.1 outer membrane receptor for ferrienterochelin and colicins [Roseovarius pacificus]